MNAATAGKWAAVSLFSFVAVLILIAAITEMSREEEGVRRGRDGDPFAPLIPEFIPEAPFVDPSEITGEEQYLAGGEEWTWHKVDESGNVQYEIRAARVDPEEGGRILLTEPRAVIFLGERVVRIAASEGEIVKPTDGEPESGRLAGGVLMEMFEVGEGGAEGLDLDGRTALGTLRTESLAFETALGQVETADDITIESEGVSFSGRGLMLRVGELERGRQYRLNLLRVEQSDGVRLRPSAFQSRDNGRSSQDANGTRAPADPGEQTEGTAPPIDHYRAKIQGDVFVSQGARRISAERLVVFARLIGGKLPDGAVTRIEIPSEETAGGARGARDGGWSESFARAPDERSDSVEAEISLTWSGALEIRPERVEPAELVRDDVLVRFESPRGNVVEMVDGETAARARCASVMYGLTSARLMMAGLGQASMDVQLAAPDVGEVVGDDLLVDLSGLPGDGRIRMSSGGRAHREAGSDPDEPGGEITWKDSAEIGFELLRQDGDLRVLARSVRLQGTVRAAQGENVVSARSMQAEFRDHALDDGGRESRLTRLFVGGSVRAQTEDGGSLEAEEAEIEFGGEAARPVPETARAHGDVRVERDGSWLSAEHLAVRFSSLDPDEIRVAQVDADTGVAMGTDRGFGATTEQLRADLETETYELTGDSTELSYAGGGARYALAAGAMRIDGRTRRLIAFGKGIATYRLTSRGAPDDSGQVEWTGGMYYDDFAGTADMIGDVVASRVPAPLERQHGEAGQVRISITPWATDREDMDERVLLGIDLEGESDTPALLELRRYREAGEADTSLETLVALRSDVIRFDAVGQVLSVPQDGLLLVEDRRVADEGVESDPGMSEQEDVRGTTAFQWEDGLEFSRPTGEARMAHGVRVRHMGLETGRLTQLECESLNARFRRPGEEVEGASPLLGVEASEAVYLRHGTIEVIGDRLGFDALVEEVEASANRGNRVTVLDSADGRHFTASQIVVDLRTGEWRAEKATGIRLSE